VGRGQEDISAKLQEAIELYEKAAEIYEAANKKNGRRPKTTSALRMPPCPPETRPRIWERPSPPTKWLCE
jgi:hypothetical protein